MLTNFFSGLLTKIVGAIAGAVGAILGKFATVAAAVAAVKILALVSVFAIMCNVIVNALCDLMTLAAKGTLGFFALDIGSGTSLFEIMFGEIRWLYPTLRILGITFVFLILLTRLFTIMISPTDKTNEHPFYLLGSATLAGVMVSAGPEIVFFFQRIFNEAFKAALLTADLEHVDFSGFANTLYNYISLEEGVIASHIDTLVCNVLLTFMMLMVAKQFFLFLMEVAKRYVILGVLLTTAPLAFSLLTSKTTRRSFGAWVRMVASQFILVIFSVIFLGVFFKSKSYIDSSLDALSASTGISGMAFAFLICSMLYGILHVAGMVDSFMRTIGLSTAETGNNFMGTLITDMLDIGAIGANPLFISGRSIFRAAQYSRHTEHSTAKTDSTKSSPVRVERDIHSGTYTINTVHAVVAGTANTSSIYGTAAGSAVLSNMSHLPSKLKNQLDPQSCRVTKGVITFESRKGKGKPDYSITLTPIDEHHVPLSTPIPKYGREVTIGGKRYIASPSGTNANSFNITNPGMRQLLADKYGEGVAHHVKIGSMITGGYRINTEQQSSVPQERFTNIHELMPDPCFLPTPELEAERKKYGSLFYWEYDMTFNEDCTGARTGRCFDPHMPSEGDMKSTWFAREFEPLAAAGFKPLSEIIPGSFIFTLEDSNFAAVPVTDWAARMDTEITEFIYSSSNNAKYILIRLETDDFTAELEEKLISRSNPDEPFCIQTTAANPGGDSKFYKIAKEKSETKNGRR